jgi:hypothetical protein
MAGDCGEIVSGSTDRANSQCRIIHKPTDAYWTEVKNVVLDNSLNSIPSMAVCHAIKTFIT